MEKGDLAQIVGLYISRLRLSMYRGAERQKR